MSLTIPHNLNFPNSRAGEPLTWCPP